ncbi:hypothetical protein HDV05_007538 [Chytridiales sp. JEL 0842]|nr:hypothetical protein HDV05_007538 [Chytridiales sp. JEL 0842]
MAAEDPLVQQDNVEEEVDDYERMEDEAGEFGISLPSVPCPADRPEAIHNIVETVDRYNPDNLGMLEDYVRDQMLNNHIDRIANLAVLKLYQFNPALTNPAIVTSILALSLANLPDPDFNLALCLLKDDITHEPNVEKLIKLQDLLERCKFKEFWTLFDNEGVEVLGLNGDGNAHNLLDHFPEFDNRVRRFISATSANAYRSIPSDIFQDFVNLEGEDFADWIKLLGCTVNSEDPTLIDFPVSKDTQPRPTIVKETIKFEQLTKIISFGRNV